MYLDARSLAIFKEIVNYPQQKSKELEKKFNLTKRQVSYSLEKVNIWLEDLKFTKIQRLSTGYFVVDKKVVSYFSEIVADHSVAHTYIFDEKERQQVLVLCLIGKTNDISLDDIAELLNVSRNTASKDLKEAEKILDQFQLAIHYSRIDGFKIIGEEIKIRQLINYLVPKWMEITNFSEFFSQIIKVNKQWFLKKIQIIEHSLGIHYTDISFHELPFMLILNINRFEQGNYLKATEVFAQTNEPINQTVEYKVIVNSLLSILPEPIVEREWLVLQMLTANLRSAQLTGQLKRNLEQAILQFIQKFEEKAVLQIIDKENLSQKLLVHMYSAYYRIKYGVSTSGDLLERIVTDYLELFELVKQTIAPIEQVIGKRFPESETAYITIFLGGELLKQGLSLETKKKALVVCTNGMSISKILKYTLKKVFPEFVFMDTLSIRQFESYEQSYDLVFSMVPLKSAQPVFIVSPLMTKEEQQLLKYHVLTELKEKTTDFLVRDILDIVKKYAEVTYEQQLVLELENFIKAPAIGEQAHDLSDELPSLTSFISSDRIQIREQVNDWQEAIQIACAPLLAQKIVTDTYVQALVAEHDREELYCFLGSEIAIPHTLTENGVLGDGFSMLILKKPVTFKNGSSVSIVVPLAILAQTNHLKAIVQLAELAENSRDTALLMEATDQESAYKIIEKFR